MDFYSCFDKHGKIIARCQSIQDIDVLKKMGRPIVKITEMKKEESVVVHSQVVLQILIWIIKKIFKLNI